MLFGMSVHRCWGLSVVEAVVCAVLALWLLLVVVVAVVCMLPGRGVPLFTLSHVSPVQWGFWMTLFWLLYDCPSVVLQPFCWNWTVVVWHEECFALCSVDSDQEALAVECPQVVPVPQDLHACWCQCH